ncbi:MAG TPA: D-alanyl-D-alanine carboxypeptidase/D-alanyl-D-alanine-endopeptidase [Cytophagaceae bacterium]|nr:D-alanyl-D-alanine carboxypeptidase/D-alanyl-D-alanine-endopeptidase [Cytophagaceae bacterium]
MKKNIQNLFVDNPMDSQLLKRTALAGLIFFLHFFCILASFGQGNSSDSVRSQLKSLEETPLLSRGTIGLWVQDQETGEVLINYNAQKSFVPASNLKVVTTASALAMLGDDYRYVTSGYITGKVDSIGVLKGNLVIIGSGDPSLGSDQVAGSSIQVLLNRWIQLLIGKGIKLIKGDIIIDPMAYNANPIPDFWPWADLGNYYGAGTHGLNISDNTLKLYFKQNKELGAPVKFLRTEPTIEGIRFDNRVITGTVGSGDEAYIYGGPYQSNRMIMGTLPPGDGEYKIKGSIPDPPLWFGYLLKQALKAKGISCKGEIKVQSASEQLLNAQDWFQHRSPPLSELIRITNFYSINLYAESLLQQIALVKKGKGDRGIGINEIKRFWSSNGIDTLGWILLDGSGLSPLNAISPQQMAAVLKYMGNHKQLQTSFIQALPAAGKDGTVYWFGKNTVLENNVRLKSGSFTSTLCYSGYMTTQQNKKVVFSIMMNRYEGEMRVAAKKLQQILERVVTEY